MSDADNQRGGLSSQQKVAIGIGATLFVFVLAASINKEDAKPDAKPTPPPAADVAQESPAPSAAPAPTHNYVHYEDGEYGYESAISDEESKNGVVQKPLILARYLGKTSDTYRIELRGGDGPARTVVTCKGACDVAKVTNFVGTLKGETQTLRINPDSIIGTVLADAIAGELEVYRKTTKQQDPEE